MTKAEFRNYVTSYNCSITPIQGTNVSGLVAKIVNRQFPSQFYYLNFPIDDREMPDKQVAMACELLGIPDPFEEE